MEDVALPEGENEWHEKILIETGANFAKFSGKCKVEQRGWEMSSSYRRRELLQNDVYPPNWRDYL
jgi:hypothetical protein